jgi:hypothetical protein
MEFPDRATGEAVDQIASLLAHAYERRRRVWRVEAVNEEVDNPGPESLHVNEVDA